MSIKTKTALAQQQLQNQKNEKKNIEISINTQACKESGLQRIQNSLLQSQSSLKQI
jgi:hypothetical protein